MARLARRAHGRGARVLVNAAPAAPLPAALTAVIDVLVVNEHEARELAGPSGLPGAPAAFAAAWHRRHGTAVVVTLGAAGVVAAADGRLHSVAAPQIEVVDTTGAGDAFVGTLAAALDRGLDWPAGARRGRRRRRAGLHRVRRPGRNAGRRPHRCAGGPAGVRGRAAAAWLNCRTVRRTCYPCTPRSDAVGPAAFRQTVVNAAAAPRRPVTRTPIAHRP